MGIPVNRYSAFTYGLYLTTAKNGRFRTLHFFSYRFRKRLDFGQGAVQRDCGPGEANTV